MGTDHDLQVRAWSRWPLNVWNVAFQIVALLWGVVLAEATLIPGSFLSGAEGIGASIALACIWFAGLKAFAHCGGTVAVARERYVILGREGGIVVVDLKESPRLELSASTLRVCDRYGSRETVIVNQYEARALRRLLGQ